MPPHRDSASRFLFDDADIRGEVVHLDDAYRDLVAIHQYPPGVALLLGEFMAAAVLLSSTLKFEGKLVLQARSERQVALLMVECDHALNLRGIARGAQQATSGRFDQLLGGGQLVITVDPVRGRRYQGIVALTGDSLSHSLDAYFVQSEQLGTRLWLAADPQRAGGLLLQQLPSRLAHDPAEHAERWVNACTLAETVTPAELLDLDAGRLLHRLFHQDPVRLFGPADVRFHCNCSRERTLNALSTLDPAEIEELLAELGSITMDCEFCNQQYRFTREDLAGVLDGRGPGALH